MTNDKSAPLLKHIFTDIETPTSISIAQIDLGLNLKDACFFFPF